MTSPPRRRLSILDALVLVAACAVGLIPLRFTIGLNLFDVDGWSAFTTPGRLSLASSLFATPPLATLTLAVLLLHARRPRRSLRRLAWRPGFLACLAASIAVLDRAGFLAVQVRTDSVRAPQVLSYHYISFAAGLPSLAGPMVLAAWIPLLLRRRWRPEPTWIDRAGCGLGACWIALGLKSEVTLIVEKLFLR